MSTGIMGELEKMNGRIKKIEEEVSGVQPWLLLIWLGILMVGVFGLHVLTKILEALD